MFHHMKRLLVYFLSAGLIAPLAARDLETHQAAEVVLGQAGFTTSVLSAAATGLSRPISIAIDPTSGKLFVSRDSAIFRYSSAAAMQSGSAAEAVLGQDSFSGTATGVGANRFAAAVYGICVDAFGRLWVTDPGNNRVLRFDNASSLASGADADGVLGQINFFTNATAFSATAMNEPTSVSMDPSGTLWVADTGNHRILGFKSAAGLGSGSAANIVLGQSSFNAQSSGLSQSKFDSPSGVFADTVGDLWVSDTGNKRILRFAAVTAYANNTTGPNATAVIGQNDFIATSLETSATKMSGAFPVTLDARNLTDCLSLKLLYLNCPLNSQPGTFLQIVCPLNYFT